MTRVAIAHGSVLLRELLDEIGPEHDVQVVADVRTGAALTAACRAEQPDVVVADAELEDGALKDRLAGVLDTGAPVLVLADEHSPEQLTEILERGASGYLLTDCTTDELLHALKTVAGGDALLAPKVAATLLAQWRRLRAADMGAGGARTALTPRERELLAEMVEGRSTKAIARALRISVKTVENHKIRIFDKLGVRTQAHAVSVAIAHGLAVGADGRGEP